MKALTYFLVTTFISSILFFGLNDQELLAQAQKSCSCCSEQGCNHGQKCSENVKDCVCSNHNLSRLQASLAKASGLTLPIFRGYLSENQRFSYFYLLSDDIFHPPRISQFK
jgi:hypothetical protein